MDYSIGFMERKEGIWKAILSEEPVGYSFAVVIDMLYSLSRFPCCLLRSLQKDELLGMCNFILKLLAKWPPMS